MMADMPKKKPAKKPAKERDVVHYRINAQEREAIDADRKTLPGIPVGRNAYAKHAVLSYPKLRKLEELMRKGALDADTNGNSADSESIYARDVLREAGL